MSRMLDLNVPARSLGVTRVAAALCVISAILSATILKSGKTTFADSITPHAAGG